VKRSAAIFSLVIHGADSPNRRNSPPLAGLDIVKHGSLASRKFKVQEKMRLAKAAHHKMSSVFNRFQLNARP
jgi:hypothetical protein